MSWVGFGYAAGLLVLMLLAWSLERRLGRRELAYWINQATLRGNEATQHARLLAAAEAKLRRQKAVLRGRDAKLKATRREMRRHRGAAKAARQIIKDQVKAAAEAPIHRLEVVSRPALDDSLEQGELRERNRELVQAVEDAEAEVHTLRGQVAASRAPVELPPDLFDAVVRGLWSWYLEVGLVGVGGDDTPDYTGRFVLCGKTFVRAREAGPMPSPH